MPLDPTLAAVLEAMAAAYPPLPAGTPEEARRTMRAMTVDRLRPEDVVPVGSVEDTTVPGAAGDLPARLYRPEAEGPRPTVLWLHGGGWVVGDLDTADQICRRICAGTEAVVVSVDYRLAPEHPYPAAYDDALAAGAWAVENVEQLGGSPTLGVGGDSAGGNLAAGIAQDRPGDVDAQLLVYPSVDMFGQWDSRGEDDEEQFFDLATMQWFGGLYLGGSGHVEPDDARLSPFRAPSLTGQPPTVLATAEHDPLRDEGQAYADALVEAGVEVEAVSYPGLVHGFLDFYDAVPAAAEAVDDVIARFAGLLDR